jgi:hypothetical protein
MHSVPTALTALSTALSRRVRPSRSECRLLTDTEDAASPAQAAARGLDGIEPTGYPPFETVSVGRPDPAVRAHGVVVVNDGPKRALSLSVDGAGVGRLFADERLLESGEALRLRLHRPDRYEVTVAAPGRPTYEVPIDAAWFARDAGVTNVVVQPDGYVRYEPV